VSRPNLVHGDDADHAVGGGGIFLSPPMVDTLDANFEECRDTAYTGFGDQRIAECINKTTDNRLTQLDGLYQIDLHGKSEIFQSNLIPCLS
jgi:hypothetical protein